MDSARIAVVGLGYVGLPLAFELARRYEVIGFDIHAGRVAELERGYDRTREVPAAWFEDTGKAPRFTASQDDLAACTIFIVTVPTPIDAHRVPDLMPLRSASRTVGQALKSGDLVIYESTVYPGATEEECVPLLEQHSGLKLNVDFVVGYSPERINPGDHEHRLVDIMKVTSGSTEAAAGLVDRLYASIIRAGTHKTSSIRAAEAAKVIENTQRDVNIALINELAMLFRQLGLDTTEVLEAAATKWNFLKFTPGLVGGHCIGVDPYYLTYKAQSVDHHPEMILAGRRTNDRMGKYVADRVMKLMTQKRIHVVGGRVLVMGVTFKENCPDIRNSQVLSLVKSLQDFHADIDLHDPWADPDEVHEEFGLQPIERPLESGYDAIVLAVPHREYLDDWRGWLDGCARRPSVIFDIKAALPIDASDERL
ncbi:Vi polysaccharide biosynthesis protein VipA/TviB [Rhodovibrio sodomensis]|uniref:Vi polysaccharide biosynthesis protein VipA/TviB n=1 Tax=Rhodovibrio sodomensis TaxID=1088 RepID=A0ABS1DMW2_9PROT|nr:nucleotide sugar dehydrogenase [Rhodovibrio sodomensis]MBK1671059.1 Vi polysaccharide biosynthesis protein VipA/TviB [Rhodovibrio sodomensis]